MLHDRAATGRPETPVLLSSLTTIGLGGPAPAVLTADDADAVAELVGAADARAGGPGALVIGGGSNLVISDEGVDVPVVRIAVRGLDIRRGTGHGTDGRGTDTDTASDAAGDTAGAIVTIGAGENWDDVVAALVDDGWTGVESLSGIPGSAGATPVQNVGAYGTEISDLLLDVQVFDRRARELRVLSAAELRLGYRTSVLRGTDRGVVTAVRLRLSRAPRPVRYAELARTLGVQVGDPAPATAVRQAVLDLRRGKGMVLDPNDPDTRSVGSFFTNPIVTDAELAIVRSAVTARLGPDATVPRYPAEGGSKLSAAWLIERAGFGKGYPGATDPAARITVSGKHTLALTNRGGGSTAELIALARTIRNGVRDAFAVTLTPEPVLVGVGLD